MEARLHDETRPAPCCTGWRPPWPRSNRSPSPLAQPRLLSPEAERELVRETSKAITRETWRELAIHARDIRFVAWLAGVLGAAAFVRRRLYAGHEVVKRLTLPERDTARRYGGDARARRGATPWPFLSYDRKSGLGRILSRNLGKGERRRFHSRRGSQLSWQPRCCRWRGKAKVWRRIRNRSRPKTSKLAAWLTPALAASRSTWKFGCSGRCTARPGQLKPFGMPSRLNAPTTAMDSVHGTTSSATRNAVPNRPSDAEAARWPAQRQDRRQRAQHVEQRVHADLDELRGEQDCAVIGEADEPFQGIKSGLLERNPDHERGRVERDGQQEQNPTGANQRNGRSPLLFRPLPVCGCVSLDKGKALSCVVCALMWNNIPELASSLACIARYARHARQSGVCKQGITR